MYRFGYCSSENSIFYHDINLLNQYHVTLRKNTKKIYRIDESLVKLLYKKYLNLYQNRKIHRTIADEKRTEYFNDFNECLVDKHWTDKCTAKPYDDRLAQKSYRRYSWQENSSRNHTPIFWLDAAPPTVDVGLENESECSNDYEDESFSLYHDTQSIIMNTNNTDEQCRTKVDTKVAFAQISKDSSSVEEAIELNPTEKDNKPQQATKGLSTLTRDPVEKEMTVTSRQGVDFEQSSWGPERKVVLNREQGKSFGISIVGGKVNITGGSTISGIFVKNIIASSPADIGHQLKVGDRILAVDGNDIRNTTHERAVQTIKNASNRLELLVQSLDKSDSNSNSTQTNRGSNINTRTNTNSNSNSNAGRNQMKAAAQEDRQVVQNNKAAPPPVTPNQTPEPQLVQSGNNNKPNGSPIPPSPSPQLQIESDEEDEELKNMEGKLMLKSGIEIDRASAGNVKLKRDEKATDELEDEYGYTKKKIQKRYGAFGQTFLFKIDRGDAAIGLSLAGHRDRTKMACFVAGLNPKGSAYNSGIQVGDEILEVNGAVVEGRCHLNVSCIIKNTLATTLFIIVARPKNSENLAVKPVTQFPVEIEQDDVCANFKNVRSMQIAKGQQSLGIMIIEGKHSEVGQGIFVSDIQQDSNAEKAGLLVGDLIIFVNRDLLLGCSYDEAVKTLKKAEGMVTLKVCNPNIGKDGVAPVAVAAAATAKPVNTDPATCDIDPNKNITIEINTENKPLGVFVVGGKDTLVTTGVVVVDVNVGSPAANDKRLQALDQILQINDVKFNAEMKGMHIHRVFKQCAPKTKLIVYRPDPAETETVDVEIVKKSGKMLGLGFRVGNPKGVVISDIIAGGIAEAEKRIQKGDIITQANSDSFANISIEECAALMKSYQGKVALKILRPKPKSRDLK